MNRVIFAEPTNASWKKWIAKCKKQSKLDAAVARSNKKIKFKDKLYKEQQKFFVDVDGPFKGKCAYCETQLYNHGGEIDHYRPKAGIKDAAGKWVQIGKRKRRNHPGYYWLAYDWLNFLPLCIGCNRIKGGHGKGNYFPLENGVHATRPSQVKREKPTLLNPRVDDPADHITFEEGTWFAVGKTQRGKATIEIIGLNERHLPRERAEAAKAARLQIIAAFAKDEDYADALKSLRGNFSPFTSVRNMVFDHEASLIEADLQKRQEKLQAIKSAREGAR